MLNYTHSRRFYFRVLISAKRNVRFFLILRCFLMRSMFYLCYLYLFTYNGVQHDFHITICLCCLIVTQRVSLIEQIQLTRLSI